MRRRQIFKLQSPELQPRANDAICNFFECNVSRLSALDEYYKLLFIMVFMLRDERVLLRACVDFCLVLNKTRILS